MVDEKYAAITCQCGQRFQVLAAAIEQEDGAVATDWDEQATAGAYHAHLATCGGGET
jgi:hypothetical protein